MFEESIITLQKPRPIWPLAATAALHLALVGTYALMPQELKDAAEEAISVEFFQYVPPPPPAPEPPPVPAAKAKAPIPTEILKIPVANVPVQPRDVPTELPVDVPTPTISSTLIDGEPGMGDQGAPGGDGDGPAVVVPIRSVEEREPDIRHVVGNVQRPVAIAQPQPQYTELARRSRFQGAVVLEAVISREGRVEEVKVLKPLSFGLTESAVAAVRKWRFEPATLDGEPVAVYYTLTVHFRLD